MKKETKVAKKQVTKKHEEAPIAKPVATTDNKLNSAINKEIAALDAQMPKDRLGDNDALCNEIKAKKEALRKQRV